MDAGGDFTQRGEARVPRPALRTKEISLLSLQGSVFNPNRRAHTSPPAESTYVGFTEGYRRTLDSVYKAVLLQHQARRGGKTQGSRRLVASPRYGGIVERAGRRQRTGGAEDGRVCGRGTGCYVGERIGGRSLYGVLY